MANRGRPLGARNRERSLQAAAEDFAELERLETEAGREFPHRLAQYILRATFRRSGPEVSGRVSQARSKLGLPSRDRGRLKKDSE